MASFGALVLVQRSSSSRLVEEFNNVRTVGDVKRPTQRNTTLAAVAMIFGIGISACSAADIEPVATTMTTTTLAAYSPDDALMTVNNLAIFMADTAERTSETENRDATADDITAAGQLIQVQGVEVSEFDTTRNRVVVSLNSGGIGVRRCVTLIEGRAKSGVCDATPTQ